MIPPRCCVLFSGGIESCVLVGVLAEAYEVFPFRVHYGLRWEEEERAACERYRSALAAQCARLVRPLTVVTVSVPDMLRPPWSLGEPVPSAESPDAAVELPNRNRVLLEAAARFCAERDIHHVAIGTLAGNPFADASPAFFREQEDALARRYHSLLRIVAPFLSLTKVEVLRRGTNAGLPIEHSLSCLNPLKGGIHCGNCNKCAERRRAFQEAGIADPTRYAAHETDGVPARADCGSGA